MWARWSLLLAGAPFGWVALGSQAAEFPEKPIRVIVPFSAGGGLDTTARLTTKKLSAGLGQQVTVDNRPGAGGTIGTVVAAKAPPDGYTLLIVSNSFAINAVLYKNPGYDAIKDFEPSTLLVSYMLYVVRHPSLPVNSIKELIALAKARPGAVNFASAGNGTTTHMSAELFSHMAGVKMTHVAYKGSAPSMTAILGGEVTLSFGSTSALPHVASGRLKLLAVTGSKRSPRFPQTPTVAESGLPGYDATGWHALFAPAGTPAPIVKRLSEVVIKGFKDPDVQAFFDKQELEGSAGTPEALAALVHSDVKKWSEVIKAAAIEQH
jgi:tripartite-type tricarboxylate transporter receptor subunit TctC